MPIITLPDGLKWHSILLLIILLLPNIVFAEESKRPSLITEEFFSDKPGLFYQRRDSYDYDSGQQKVKIWNKLLIGMDIKAVAPPSANWSIGNCQYDSAIKVLEQIRAELGKETPYQKIWAENQDRVFSACDFRHNNPLDLVEPKGELPKRAESDFLYQKASQHFYRGDFIDAMQIYKKIVHMYDAPIRPMAAYMSLRTMVKLGGEAEAYNLIDVVLADDSLKSVHDITANYKFIMGWYGAPDPEKHLNWLLKTIKVTPEKAVNLKQSFNDYSDAMEQLNTYFPVYDGESKTVDWWLRDIPVSSGRMKAVEALAPKNELVDWMQAKWAYNIFDTDWLFALHIASNPYWEQNRNIVTHAWQRWKNGDGLEWLQIAARRAHPEDELAGNILKELEPYFNRAWKNETQEYRYWLLDMWEQAIRIHLGREEYKEALNLVEQHVDYSGLELEMDSPYSSRNDMGIAILQKSLRWLVYTGKVDEARAQLAAILKIYPDKFQHWRTLLATSWDEVVKINRNHNPNSWENTNSPELWKKMVDAVSTQELYNLANSEETLPLERPLFARAAVTRAFLLGFDKDKFDTYAKLAAKLNPPVRQELLTAAASNDRYKFIEFLVRSPRFRPNPYLEYVVTNNSGNGVVEDMSKIDTYNHNDNNWWCKVDEKNIEDGIFEAARIRPPDISWGLRKTLIDGVDIHKEIEPYIEKQKVLMEQHPYRSVMNKNELEQLEELKSGPEYLSRSIIARANIERWKFWNSENDNNQIASDLSNAIRTTRYGCASNGSHADYSHKAYKILHKRYGYTTWAKATPFWFGCIDSSRYPCKGKNNTEH